MARLDQGRSYARREAIHSGGGLTVEPLWWTVLEHFGWFASGVLFYEASELRSDKLYLFAIATALVCALTSLPWQCPWP